MPPAGASRPAKRCRARVWQPSREAGDGGAAGGDDARQDQPMKPIEPIPTPTCYAPLQAGEPQRPPYYQQRKQMEQMTAGRICFIGSIC